MNRNRHRRTTFTDQDIAIAYAVKGCTCRPNVKRRHAGGTSALSRTMRVGPPSRQPGTRCRRLLECRRSKE